MVQFLLIVFALLAWSPPAGAEIRRFAILAGNNEGSPGMHPLYFAEDDASKMGQVLVEVGGYNADDVRYVLGGSRNDLLSALVGVRGDISLARERGYETLFVFYYSGHADENRLHLGRSWITYDELDDLLERTEADVRLAFLDACQSGAMTRSKGGTLAPSFVFDITEKLGASGQVIITSSSGDEASQESDEIGGSYFTHFLTTALVGAADDDGDELVTLDEAYRYVYHETIYRTATTRSGAQHPTYEWDLAGKGDVVLADLSAARSTLAFTPRLQGIYAIFDQSRRMFVAEVELYGESRDLALRPGPYLIQKRYPSHLEVARVHLADGARIFVDQLEFEAVEYEEDLAKGAIEERLRKARMPRLSVRAMVGQRRFADDTVDASYLPATPVAGAALRFNWRDGRWAQADLLSGARTTSLTFEEFDYAVPVALTSSTFGLSAGYATAPRLFRLGGGLRLAGAYFRRDFIEEDQDPQDIFSVSPGWTVWGGMNYERVELELELRGQYLPYHLDDRTKGLNFHELFLTFGYRF